MSSLAFLMFSFNSAVTALARTISGLMGKAFGGTMSRVSRSFILFLLGMLRVALTPINIFSDRTIDQRKQAAQEKLVIANCQLSDKKSARLGLHESVG